MRKFALFVTVLSALSAQAVNADELQTAEFQGALVDDISGVLMYDFRLPDIEASQRFIIREDKTVEVVESGNSDRFTEHCKEQSGKTIKLTIGGESPNGVLQKITCNTEPVTTRLTTFVKPSGQPSTQAVLYVINALRSGYELNGVQYKANGDEITKSWERFQASM
ncbi:hypothetical protein [Vibrio sp.]|uniref:hypothetical protein n=1 Tax=Vibrio sp. TaxID=678 RepID=UPI002AA87884|nr:hypothetical protein [uncultured Vibrio sp.]